jgi:anthranilate phosphoribosyltransferase
MKEWIKILSHGKSLDQDQASLAMLEIMEGRATSAQIAAFVTALRMKGENVDEITGLARVMREKSEKIPHHQESCLDTCGTGGDSLSTFNISTTAAFVAAGAGAVVAKHGNRAASSQCGSADVLAQLGVKIEIPVKAVGKCLDEAGIGFLFAPLLHSSMKHAMPTRKEIGIRTVFNILGPLTNPAGATHQLLGVFDGDLVEVMAEVLLRLGCRHALVVNGMDGMDEVSVVEETRVAELKNGKIRTFYVDPADYFGAPAKMEELSGKEAEFNATIIRGILEGTQGAKRNVVLINAAAALVASDKAETLAQGLEMAIKSLDTKSALNKLEILKEKTLEF